VQKVNVSTVCPIVATNAAETLKLFADVHPELLCIDESIEVTPEWPLFHENAIRKEMRSIPIVLMIDSLRTRDYAFSKDHCVCRVRKGPRLIEAVQAFSEELMSTSQLVEHVSTDCRAERKGVTPKFDGNKNR
jgi:hypothetical protein